MVSFENQLMIKLRTNSPAYTPRFGVTWEVGVCSQTTVFAFYSLLFLESPIMGDVSLKIGQCQPLPICGPVLGGGFGQRGWLLWLIASYSNLFRYPDLGHTYLWGPWLSLGTGLSQGSKVPNWLCYLEGNIYHALFTAIDMIVFILGELRCCGEALQPSKSK